MRASQQVCCATNSLRVDFRRCLLYYIEMLNEFVAQQDCWDWRIVMKNVVGDPVLGENFFGRQAELDLLWRKVERQSLVLAAPRRVGKTSLMYRMRDQPREGWLPVHFNAESCQSEAQFVGELLAAVRKVVDDSWWKQLPSWRDIKGLFARIEKLDAKVLSLELAEVIGAADRWRGLGAELMGRLAANEQRTLVMIDELPYFVQRLSRAKEPATVEVFLHWCRAMRQELAGRGGQVRFILYGSIGLDAVLRRLGLSATVNDLDVVPLGPFDESTARRMLQLLAADEELPVDEATVNRVLAKLGGWFIPFHLQLIFSRLSDRFALRGQKPSPTVVDSVYHDELLHTSHRKYFAHWDERLDDLLPTDQAQMARQLLSAAIAPNGLSHDTATAVADAATPRGEPSEPGALDQVLDLLLHDGYLVQDADRLRFASALLRDWWGVFHPGG